MTRNEECLSNSLADLQTIVAMEIDNSDLARSFSDEVTKLGLKISKEILHKDIPYEDIIVLKTLLLKNELNKVFEEIRKQRNYKRNDKV